MNCFEFDDHCEYPISGGIYSPECRYPEYPFDDNVGGHKNDIYRMIRNVFINLCMDEANIGTNRWNPFKDYVKSGDTVLIKPNLVMHKNLAEADMKRGMECMVTHPSVTRCVFDYVYIALKGSGKIIIADAPVQDCDFDELLNNSGYGVLFEYLKSKETRELKIEIGDLRDTKLINENGYQRQVERTESHYKGKVVNIKEISNFNNLKKKNRLRVTNYHGGDTVSHHSREKNEYCISEAALQADVIFNLVKPKTHRIAGYTAALKNMIGLSTRKEYLPHHRKGSVGHGGDEYVHTHTFLKFLNSTGNDVKNWALKHRLHVISDTCNEFCRLTGKKLDRLEKSRKKFGMWSGNDTIWRTILDVNYIIRYCDKNGEMRPQRQRKIVHIGDMIVCGEKEGPLRPSYKKVGGILFSEHAIEFDLCVVKLMGLDYRRFPVLWNAVKDKRLYTGVPEQVCLLSNNENFNGCVENINKTFDFCLTMGWREEG